MALMTILFAALWVLLAGVAWWIVGFLIHERHARAQGEGWTDGL